MARLAAAGAAAYFVPAWNERAEAADTVACVAATPTVTEGPYWVDEKLFRSDIRTDPATGVARAGTPLTLTIKVLNLSSGACAPLTGAWVDIWHCDAKGIYSDEPTYNPGGGTGSVNTSGQKFLRGYQITDNAGQVTFTTIYPGWDSGRTIHIHFRVRTYSGTTVLGNFVSQIFFDDAVNNAVLAQSAYSRTTGRDTSNSNDMVYSVANRERMLAVVSGTNAGGYAASITAGVSLKTAPVASPSISAGGVVNAVGGAAGVTANSWISIYGANFAATSRALAASDLVNDTIPTSLEGVSVQINGKAAYIGYVSPAQLNVLTPDDPATGSVAVTVTNAAGTSNSLAATAQSVLPGLSTLSNYVRAIRYPDSAIVNGTGAAEGGYTVSAAVGQGDIVALYGTGFGPTNPLPVAGTVFAGAYPTTSSVTVTIGGAAAEVLWSGLAGAGLYQINVRVPATLGDGNHEAIATVAGLQSQAGAILKVAAQSKLSARTSFKERLRGIGEARNAVPPSAFGKPESLLRFAGLTGGEWQPEAGGLSRKLHLQARERTGGIVRPG